MNSSDFPSLLESFQKPATGERDHNKEIDLLNFRVGILINRLNDLYEKVETQFTRFDAKLNQVTLNQNLLAQRVASLEINTRVTSTENDSVGVIGSHLPLKPIPTHARLIPAPPGLIQKPPATPSENVT